MILAVHLYYPNQKQKNIMKPNQFVFLIITLMITFEYPYNDCYLHL